MTEFSGAIFGGYKKNEVDEFVNNLSQENIKYKEEIKKLNSEIADLKKASEEMKASYEERISVLNEDLKNSTLSFRAMERVLSAANIEAAQMLADANADAESIKDRAAAEAGALKTQTEEECRRKNLKTEEQFRNAQSRIRNYVDMLNRNKEQLLVLSNELAQLVSKMPFCLEDFMSEKEEEILDGENLKYIEKVD